MNLTQTVAPAAEPISRDDAKEHLRVTHTDDDDYIDALIAAARARLDGITGILGRALIDQTWTLELDEFPANGEIRIPLAPLSSITQIDYRDADSVSQTLATSVYTTTKRNGVSYVVRKDGQSWPAIDNDPDAVTVTFVAGYGEAGSDVPPALIAAMKLHIGHMYENREAVVVGTIASDLPLGYEALVDPFKIWQA